MRSVYVVTLGVRSFTSFLEYNEDPVEYVAILDIIMYYKSYRGIGQVKNLVWITTFFYRNYTYLKLFGAGMALKTYIS